MPIPEKRQVAAVYGDGHIRLIQETVPELTPGTVLVQVQASLVSPGTELRGGWRNLARLRDNPEREAAPRPFGYSNAGIVIEVGEGVKEFQPGERVACVGGGYALHTDYAVVPHNLCVPLPDPITFAQGAYAMLSATGLYALRRGEPEFGEFVAVVGLGLVGQLTAQLYRLAGNYVIGWDTVPLRTTIAKQWGIDATVTPGREDEVAATKHFTRGYGLDAGVLAFGGDGNDAVQKLEKCMKRSPDGHPMGRIVVVGGTKFQYQATLSNIDIRRAARTGPGYHDPAWEYGQAYPPVFMRWTTRTNLELCLRLMAEGKLKVDLLTTHTIPLARVDEEISMILADPDAILGVVFVMS